jgi:hypothetical protein
MRKFLLITAALAAMAAPAAGDTGGGTRCVRHNDIYNWTGLSDKLLVVENYRHQKVLLKLIGTCYGFKFRETIGFRNRGGSDLDCIGPGDEVFVRDRGLGGRCAVVSVAPYDGQVGSHASHDNDNADDRGGDHHDHGSY